MVTTSRPLAPSPTVLLAATTTLAAPLATVQVAAPPDFMSTAPATLGCTPIPWALVHLGPPAVAMGLATHYS